MNEQIITLPSESYDLFTTVSQFNLDAEINSGLSLSYESQDNTVVNINSTGIVTVIGPGKTLIKIFNNGNINWAPVEKFVLINIKKRKQNINFFNIENKYITDPLFSLNSYGFATSGLPLKYKSLTPDIAQITENGDVSIVNVGRAIVEVVQEGNFEWESVKILQEFGVSFRFYPFDLELKSNLPNTLIKFDLYKNVQNTLLKVSSISGGLYFGNIKYNLTKNLLLQTGDYIGVINYDYVASGSPVLSTINTTYSFYSSIFSGKNEDDRLCFSIYRDGFLNFGIDVIVQAVFDRGRGYKYVSQEVLESGIFWSGSFAPNKDELVFALPLLYNNKYERDVAGKLKFTFINKSGIPDELLKSGAYMEASFIISTGKTTLNASNGILPYYPKILGSDLVNSSKEAKLDPNNYPKIK
jgi:hypothetical protein